MNDEGSVMPDKRRIVLLVEDNLDDAKFVTDILKKTNPNIFVEHVRDAVNALDFLFKTGLYRYRLIDLTPDLILLDISLPRLSGLDVLRIVKSYARLQHIPAVVLTSSSEERHVLESYKLGASDYVTKPIDYAQFQQAIQTIVLRWLPPDQAPANTRSETSSSVPEILDS
jgi:two-component system, response regulator